MRSPLLILPISAGVMWGAAGVFVRVLSDAGMDSMTVVLSRNSLATLMMLAVILLADRELLRIRPRDIWLFIACGVSMMLLNTFYTVSADEVALSLAAVLLSLSPAFMLILARLIFRERITSRKVLCMLVSVAGCVLVSGLVDSGGSSVSPMGVAAGLASAMFYAVYGILSKRTAAQGYSIYTILFYGLLVSTLILIPLSDPAMILEYGSRGGWEVLFLLVHAAVASFLPYLLYTVGMARLEAGTASILAACGEPMAAAVFGMVFFSEVPTPLMALGMAMAIGAMAFMCMPQKPSDRGSDGPSA